MSLKIGASTFGESRLRMLRIVRRGDRHDARDLTISCRFEGDFVPAFEEGASGGVLPGEAVKNLVHATARAHGGGEIESLGIALCQRVLEGNPRITRARADIEELPWARVVAGGKPQGQVFVAPAGEARIAAVTSNGTQTAVVAGIENLMLMRSSGFAPPRRPEDGDAVDDTLQPLLVGVLSARWTYNTPDVTFGPFRQGVRAAILETVARHAARSVQHMLYGVADVVLASYEEISDVTLAMRERPYRAADLFSAGIENPDELFVAADEPLGIVEVTVERNGSRQ
jgi:urate oxidase